MEWILLDNVYGEDVELNKFQSKKAALDSKRGCFVQSHRIDKGLYELINDRGYAIAVVGTESVLIQHGFGWALKETI